MTANRWLIALSGALAVTVVALAIVIVNRGGSDSETTGHSAQSSQQTVTTSAPTSKVRVPTDPDRFLSLIKYWQAGHTLPFDRANEICDWFDQGYKYDQILDMETAVLKRNWPDRDLMPTNEQAGALVAGAATYFCPEHRKEAHQ